MCVSGLFAEVSFGRRRGNFLLDQGFIEINNTVLETTTGGADANPFVTHMDALDQEFYLRIAQELPQKRLLVAGFEKVFDIGPRPYRNSKITAVSSICQNTTLWEWVLGNDAELGKTAWS